MTRPLPKSLVRNDYPQSPRVALIKARREELRVSKYVNSSYNFFTGRELDFYDGIVKNKTMNFSGGAVTLMSILKTRRVRDSLEFSEWCAQENIHFEGEQAFKDGDAIS